MTDAQAVRAQETVTFRVPLPHRALRVNSRTASTGYRARLVREYQEEVVCAVLEADGRGRPLIRLDHDPWERARLRLEWRHAGVAPDQDNALAALKPLIDVLHTRSNRPLGIVVDDSPEHLMIEPVKLVKVRHRTEECVIVTIERVGGEG